MHCLLQEISKENNNLNYDLFWVFKDNDKIICPPLKFDIRTWVNAWCLRVILRKKEV